MVDYHLHTTYSFDAKNTMSEMAERAVTLGLTEIALTDHCDFLPISTLPNYDAYRKELEETRKKFPTLKIVFGAEIGIGTHTVEKTKKLLANDFEFVIGSIHDVAGEDIYFPTLCGTKFYDGKTKEEAYNEYFRYTLDSIKANTEFNVLGHLDSIERYAVCFGDKTLRYDEYKGIIDEILLELISTGRGIEVNTSGERYGVGHFHPHADIIRAYKRLGGEIITVGSDAHNINDLGSNIENAAETLKQCGFDYVSVFRDGRAEKIGI